MVDTIAPAPGRIVPLTYEVISDLSSAIGLSDIPEIAQEVAIQVFDQPVRFMDTGDDPTSTFGLILYPGQLLNYDGDMSRIKFIETTAGASLIARYATPANPATLV